MLDGLEVKRISEREGNWRYFCPFSMFFPLQKKRLEVRRKGKGGKRCSSESYTLSACWMARSATTAKVTVSVATAPDLCPKSKGHSSETVSLFPCLSICLIASTLLLFLHSFGFHRSAACAVALALSFYQLSEKEKEAREQLFRLW